MPGIRSNTMRDLQYEDAPSEFSAWVNSLDDSKQGNLDPGEPKHKEFIGGILSAVESGQATVEDVRKLSRLNPRIAPLLYGSFGQQQKARGREKLLGQYFQPDQNVVTGGEEDQMTRFRPGKADFENAINELIGKGDVAGAKELSQLAGKGGEMAKSVQEWLFLKNEFKNDPNFKVDFPTYQTMKRAGYTVGDIGGVPSQRPTIAGLPAIPLSTLQKEVVGKSAIEGGKKAAEVKAGAQAQAEVDLGSNLDEIQKMKEGVSGFLSAPGFKTVYGITRPAAFIPATDAADAEARRNQLEAQSFGISIQKMRGLGQLSEAEGKKVTAAYTRAINPSQSAKAAREAWIEVNRYLNVAEKRAFEKAGKTQPDKPVSREDRSTREAAALKALRGR